MIRALALTAFLLPSTALAQSASPMGAGTGDSMPMNGPHMMMHAAAGAPAQPGQSAFEAIQEIVAILMADPRTDWSKVNIEALRQHLIDMNNVTLAASVQSTVLPDGVLFSVTGEGPVRESIRRMVLAHAATMDGVNGWKLVAAKIKNGASFKILVPASDMQEVQGLGFIGLLTLGMHHQAHHLMIAKGQNPHN